MLSGWWWDNNYHIEQGWLTNPLCFSENTLSCQATETGGLVRPDTLAKQGVEKQAWLKIIHKVKDRQRERIERERERDMDGAFFGISSALSSFKNTQGHPSLSVPSEMLSQSVPNSLFPPSSKHLISSLTHASKPCCVPQCHLILLCLSAAVELWNVYTLNDVWMVI